MIEKKTLISVMSGVLVGGMLLSGGMVFAGDAASKTVQNFTYKMPFFGHGVGFRDGMFGQKGPKGGEELNQKNLSLLVEKGVITQDTATAIQQYIDTVNQEKKGRGDLFAQLVSNNILTQAQVDSIKTTLQGIREEEKQATQKKALQTLIDKGTITQDQADKITAAFANAEKAQASLMTKIENMTVKEAREYFQESNHKPKDVMSTLVNESVITQAQADAFQAAMREAQQAEHQQQVADGIAALVTKGTLSQAQADKVTSAFAAAQKSREEEMQKLQQMTEEQRQQYRQENKENQKKLDPVSQLVTDGVITQDQAVAIHAVVGQGGPGGPGGFGFRGFGHGRRH